jgi:hypothetical protein
MNEEGGFLFFPIEVKFSYFDFDQVRSDWETGLRWRSMGISKSNEFFEFFRTLIPLS